MMPQSETTIGDVSCEIFEMWLDIYYYHAVMMCNGAVRIPGILTTSMVG